MALCGACSRHVLLGSVQPKWSQGVRRSRALFPCRLGDAHAHMAAGHGATSSAGMLGGALTAVQCREGMLSVLMPSSLLAGVYAKHTSPRTIWFLQHTCCGRRCSGRGRRCRFLCARSIWARGVCRRLAGGSAPSAHVHTLCCGLFADFNLLAVSFSRLLERRCFLAAGGEAVVAPAVVWWPCCPCLLGTCQRWGHDELP